MEAGQLLKPGLARGDLQVLGLTTFDEYRAQFRSVISTKKSNTLCTFMCTDEGFLVLFVSLIFSGWLLGCDKPDVVVHSDEDDCKHQPTMFKGVAIN